MNVEQLTLNSSNYSGQITETYYAEESQTSVDLAPTLSSLAEEPEPSEDELASYPITTPFSYRVEEPETSDDIAA